jgi:uridine kinase
VLDDDAMTCANSLTSTFLYGSLQVNAADVIILEGILVFHDARVRGLMNMKIFVDTGLSIFFFRFGCLSQYLLSNSC